MQVDKNKVQNLREDYRAKSLSIEEVSNHPVQQFDQWFLEAMKSEVREPNAMTLATSTKAGRPSARIVLLKAYDEKGFVFYTNYNSKKGKELNENPFAAMVFCWLDLERQIRIEGKIEKLSPEASDQYFQSRPKGSQIGAWASPQSDVINDRSLLENNVEKLKAKYKDAEALPRPEHWGGYRLVPDLVEFWQGRSSRLHDRINYHLDEGEWKLERLAP